MEIMIFYGVGMIGIAIVLIAFMGFLSNMLKKISRKLEESPVHELEERISQLENEIALLKKDKR